MLFTAPSPRFCMGRRKKSKFEVSTNRRKIAQMKTLRKHLISFVCLIWTQMHRINQNPKFKTHTLHWSMSGLCLNLFDNKQ